MIRTKELDNGMIEVSSDSGFVDIGAGAIKKLIISKDELEYVTVSKEE